MKLFIGFVVAVVTALVGYSQTISPCAEADVYWAVTRHEFWSHRVACQPKYLPGMTEADESMCCQVYLDEWDKLEEK